jgi:hypothetical protein
MKPDPIFNILQFPPPPVTAHRMMELRGKSALWEDGMDNEVKIASLSDTCANKRAGVHVLAVMSLAHSHNLILHGGIGSGGCSRCAGRSVLGGCSRSAKVVSHVRVKLFGRLLGVAGISTLTLATSASGRTALASGVVLLATGSRLGLGLGLGLGLACALS